MSDVPQQRSEQAKTLDFTGVTVLGLPAGGGIASINGDATPAQSLSAFTPGSVSDLPGGQHIVFFPVFNPAVPGPSTPGLVPDPGAAGPTDYLAADATFKPLPGASIPSSIEQLSFTIPGVDAATNGTVNLFVIPNAKFIPTKIYIANATAAPSGCNISFGSLATAVNSWKNTGVMSADVGGWLLQIPNTGPHVFYAAGDTFTCTFTLGPGTAQLVDIFVYGLTLP